MPRGKSPDPDVKAAAVADLMLGKSVTEVAALHGVSESTVRGWRDRAQADGGLAVVRDKNEGFDELLFGYLRASINALTVQVQVFGDRDWLKKQNANDLAVLHGVSIDKIVRILSALEQAGDA